MPYQWYSHFDGEGLDSADSFLFDVLDDGAQLASDDVNLSVLDVNVLEECFDVGARSELQHPICSTPDRKRRRLDGDELAQKRDSSDSLPSGRVKRPMNAFMLWSQVSVF